MDEKSLFPDRDAAVFQRHSWLHRETGRRMDLACITKDIAEGISLVVNTLERVGIENMSDTKPMYDVNDCGILARLAITSLDLLVILADRDIERRNDKFRAAKAAKEGK